MTQLKSLKNVSSLMASCAMLPLSLSSPISGLADGNISVYQKETIADITVPKRTHPIKSKTRRQSDTTTACTIVSTGSRKRMNQLINSLCSANTKSLPSLIAKLQLTKMPAKELHTTLTSMLQNNNITPEVVYYVVRQLPQKNINEVYAHEANMKNEDTFVYNLLQAYTDFSKRELTPESRINEAKRRFLVGVHRDAVRGDKIEWNLKQTDSLKLELKKEFLEIQPMLDTLAKQRVLKHRSMTTAAHEDAMQAINDLYDKWSQDKSALNRNGLKKQRIYQDRDAWIRKFLEYRPWAEKSMSTGEENEVEANMRALVSLHWGNQLHSTQKFSFVKAIRRHLAAIYDAAPAAHPIRGSRVAMNILHQHKDVNNDIGHTDQNVMTAWKKPNAKMERNPIIFAQNQEKLLRAIKRLDADKTISLLTSSDIAHRPSLADCKSVVIQLGWEGKLKSKKFTSFMSKLNNAELDGSNVAFRNYLQRSQAEYKTSILRRGKHLGRRMSSSFFKSLNKIRNLSPRKILANMRLDSGLYSQGALITSW